FSATSSVACTPASGADAAPSTRLTAGVGRWTVAATQQLVQPHLTTGVAPDLQQPETSPLARSDTRAQACESSQAVGLSHAVSSRQAELDSRRPVLLPGARRQSLHRRGHERSPPSVHSRLDRRVGRAAYVASSSA